MEKIVSLQNRKVKEWTSLRQKKYRDAKGQFIVEGVHLVGEAMAAGCMDALIWCGEKPLDFEPSYEVTEDIMRKLSVTVSGTACAAVCRFPVFSTPNPSRIVLLDGVQDPGNLGTIVRTAVSFGFDALYCSEDCADLFNEKTVRSTQGALFQIPVTRTDLSTVIGGLKQEGFTVIGTALRDAVDFRELAYPEKTAFVFGNEGNGIREEILDLCDVCTRIEMSGFESLNVAVAAGIVMYRYRKTV